MNFSIARQTVLLIQKYQDKNMFYDNESVKTKIGNRDYATKNGEKDLDTKFPDAYIDKVVRKNTRNRAFEATAKKLYKAIQDKDFNLLISRVRYDQKLTLDLFELYSGIKLKGLSNKKIEPIIINLCK